MAGTTKSIGLCLIGPGAIAERHLQAFEQLGGVLPQWVVSRTAQAADDFARRWKFAQAGTSFEEALRDPLVEVALITSPSPLHSEQAIQAMQAGKDVVVEIPVALTWPDAQRVAQVAAAMGRRAWVCHTLRSTAALREVRKRISSGRLHVTQIVGFFGIPRRHNQGMGNVGTRNWIDNLLWHHGCHQIDASLWALGMPPVRQVRALFGPAHPKFGMALDVGVQMVTHGGELITHSLSYNVEHLAWQLKFIGHEDVLTIQDGRLTNEAGQELVPETSMVDLSIQSGELLEAFRAGAECEFELAKVLPTMECLGKAQQSTEETR